MVRKKERLTREAFNRFFSLGRRMHTPAFQCVYTKHPTFHTSVVVPKKILTKATARNSLRRRVYNLLRRAEKKQGIFILIAKKPAATITKTTLQQEITTIIREAEKI